DKPFEARVFTPEDVPNEHRGAGQVGGTCLRFVRTIFDNTNSDANAELVLGEVITMPGKWSSYPPHHHPQPEIYHYRFTDPRGFGHAELGEDVLKVRQYDTVKIFGPNDHPQCAAPGYGMYYSWVIRHLPGDRYTVPEFTEDHTWTLADDARFWEPKAG
ncbi:MAG: 5-deoxy-glucuronate isomerase, partial [Rhodospirillales bacterium]|nr:5-deoxy-glucuronate isomerase [Rhodospirillales bacterium]